MKVKTTKPTQEIEFRFSETRSSKPIQFKIDWGDGTLNTQTSHVYKMPAIKKPYINVIKIPLTAIRREPTVPKKPPILSRNLFKSMHRAKTAKLYDAILKYFLSNLGLRKITRLLSWKYSSIHIRLLP